MIDIIRSKVLKTVNKLVDSVGLWNDVLVKDVVITVRRASGDATLLHPKKGANLREVLLDSGNAPYRGVYQKMNCHGLGVCGSCWVNVLEAGQRWPRRSCQIQCFQSMEIELQ